MHKDSESLSSCLRCRTVDCNLGQFDLLSKQWRHAITVILNPICPHMITLVGTCVSVPIQYSTAFVDRAGPAFILQCIVFLFYHVNYEDTWQIKHRIINKFFLKCPLIAYSLRKSLKTTLSWRFMLHKSILHINRLLTLLWWKSHPHPVNGHYLFYAAHSDLRVLKACFFSLFVLLFSLI